MFPRLCRATEQDTFRKLYRCVVQIKMRTLYIIRPRNTEYLYSQRWSCYEIAPAMTPFNILIDDNSSHYNIIAWIPAPDTCLHEHNNTSYAIMAGKNLLMTSDYSWMWTSGCWQVLQLYGCFRQRSQFVFLELSFQCFFIFLKIGSFKKKRNHKHTSNVVLWMACKCFRCSRQKQTKNLVNKDQHLRIMCFKGTLQNLMAKEQRCMTHECFCHVSVNIILRKPLNIAVIFSVCLYVSPVLHNKSDPLPL